MNPIIPIYEYKVLQSIEQVERDYDIQFSLRITERCNISCEYCLWNHDIKYEHKSIDIIVDRLYELLAVLNKKSVLIYFHGGEPTTHPNLIQILKYIREKEQITGIKTYIEFQTNLVVKLEKLKDIIEIIDGLNISLHLKELIKTNSLKVFEKNYDYLVEINYPILNLDVMLEYNIYNMFSYLRKVLKFLKYENIKISEMVYAYIDFDEKKDRYNNSIRKQEYQLYEKLYKKYNKNEQQYQIDGVIYSTNDLFLQKLNCYGLKCIAGINHLIINGDGNVFICNTHMTNYINDRGGEVFTNLLNDANAVNKLRILNKLKCVTCKVDECSSDFYFSKWVA